MRKATSAASKNLPLLSLCTSFCCAQKLSFFISRKSYQNSHHFYGDQITHEWLVQLLQEPTMVQSLSATKALHALTITLGPNPSQPIFQYNNIIGRYATLGKVGIAGKLFDNMGNRNVVSYNTMIKAYSRGGILDEAWKLFCEMRVCGFKPTQFTFGGLLTCGVMSLAQGFQLVALIVKYGYLHSDAFVGTALLDMFGSRGCLDEAIRVFDDMPEKNLVTHNCIMYLFGKHGFVKDSIWMLVELMRNGVELSESTFVGVLSGLIGELDLELGKQLHSTVMKYGFDKSVCISNSLISMYAKCGGIFLAEKLFEEVPVKDIVSWNTIIGAMAKGDRPVEAFVGFLKMRQEGILPNETTFANVLNSCFSLTIPFCGEYIHAMIIKTNLQCYVYVGSALVDFYAKSDKLGDAHFCFDEIAEKNIVSWNSLIAGYSNRDSSASLLLLREMIHLGYCPNEFSFSAVVKSSRVLEVQQLHSLIMKMGYQKNEYVLSSLISSYAKSGLIADALIFVAHNDTPLPVVPSNVVAGIYNRTGLYEKAQELYSTLEDPDIVSWNILIAACTRNSDYKEAFELFYHMLRDGILADNYTYVSLFTVCTKLCYLALGGSLHGRLVKTDFKCCDTFVNNVMIDMYGKCGSLHSSMKIFDEMTNKNVISWTAIISSLGLNGYGHEALEKFRRMEIEGFKPDKVAFISVISACRHAGLVTQGMELFNQMKQKYGVEPEMDHYLLVVDLLARYGHIREAEEFINQMPFPPNAFIWRSFLEGCKRKTTVDNLALAV